MAMDLIQTFHYDAKEALIEDIKTGISITIRIDGLDSTGTVAYYGIIVIPEVTGKLMEITIEANQVTPFAPSNLVAQELSYNQIRLIWSDNSSNEDYFVVYLFNDVDSTYDSIAWVATNSYTDSGLTQLTLYQYMLKAVNQAGYSNPSNSASATTLFLDNLGPVITVESHTDPDTVNKQTIMLYGEVKDSSDIHQFFVNNLLIETNDNQWLGATEHIRIALGTPIFNNRQMTRKKHF